MTEDEYIGSAGSYDIEITSTDINKSYCGNCKKNQHCIHGTKKEKDSDEIPPVIMLKDKCNNDICECKCRRFYSAKNGKLRRLGTIDDTDPLEGFNMNQKREKIDDIIDILNNTIRKKD